MKFINKNFNTIVVGLLVVIFLLTFFRPSPDIDKMIYYNKKQHEELVKKVDSLNSRIFILESEHKTTNETILLIDNKQNNLLSKVQGIDKKITSNFSTYGK